MKHRTLLKTLPLQNKTKTYLLIAAVLGVWGAIAYQIVSGVSPDDAPELVQNDTSKFNPKPIASKDTFSIQPVKRDPFLGTLSSKTSKKVSSVKSSEVVKRDIEFPSVIYNARIKKPNTDTSLFILTINNQQYKLKKGQIADSLKLVNGNAETIVVRYKNLSKTIKRQ